MKLLDALKIAEAYKEIISPFCHRIEIAGSIRRRKPEVKDIELVAIPKIERLMDMRDVFRKWTHIKGQVTGKYMAYKLPEGINLDFFMCSKETWGCNFLIRTGSADFSHALVSRVPRFKFREARLWCGDNLLETPEEKDVFGFLGLQWIEPPHRIDGNSIGFVSGAKP